MQIADTFSKSPFHSPQGGEKATPEITTESQRQQIYHRRILSRRALRYWWYRILIVVLAGIAAAIMGELVFPFPKEILGAIFGLPVIFVLFKRIEYGLLLTAMIATALVPKVFAYNTLDVYPAIPMLLALFFLVIVQIAFRIRKPVLPSFWVIWPQIGLVVLAIVSEIVVQFTWTHVVPHKVLNNPIFQEELTGVAIYLFPLITLFTTTAILTKNEQYIEYILRGYLILAVVGSLILIVDFRRLGGDVYTFRFTEPSILWMTLRSLCQLLVQGAIIGYAYFLYATKRKRRSRFIYAVVTIICLLSVYLSLQNSWWVEVGVAFIVMTAFYSRRLFLSLCIAAIPFLPLVKAEYDKLAALKTNDLNRLTIWQDMIRVWSKQPVFGVGPGNVWAYDQVYTQLPLTLRNLGHSGLGVAHNGYLQTFAETGLLGLCLYLASIVVLILASRRLFRRSTIQEERAKGFWGWIGLKIVPESEESSGKRKDRILAISALGLVAGSAAADCFTSSFFLPPRQMHTFVTLTPVVTSWVIWACVLYKDQLWRMARRR